MEIIKDDEWSLYPNFTKREFMCHHTGLCEMTHNLLQKLQAIRDEYGKPMVISSGYRDVSHPLEKHKKEPGEHTLGMAADVLVHGIEAAYLVSLAVEMGIKRIGVNQCGDYSSRFIHLGVGDIDNGRFPVSMWSY